jgi:argininosuccinate lyase
MTDNASKKPDAAKGGEGQAMWGGRFSAKPAELMQAINVSIGFDKRWRRRTWRGPGRTPRC